MRQTEWEEPSVRWVGLRRVFVFGKIRNGPREAIRVVFKEPKTTVAFQAKKSAHFPSDVVMVNRHRNLPTFNQRRFGFSANSAAMVLCFANFRHLRQAQPTVFFTEMVLFEFIRVIYPPSTFRSTLSLFLGFSGLTRIFRREPYKVIGADKAVCISRS